MFIRLKCLLLQLQFGFTPYRLCSIENRRARFKGCLLGMLGFTVPLLLLVALVLGSLSRDVLELMLGDKGTEALSLYVVSMYMHSCVRGFVILCRYWCKCWFVCSGSCSEGVWVPVSGSAAVQLCWTGSVVLHLSPPCTLLFQVKKADYKLKPYSYGNCFSCEYL